MKKTNIFKKVLTLGLALAIVLGMGTATFAHSNDPNFTAAPNTSFTTFLNTGNNFEAQIGAGPANASFVFSGFEDETKAGNVTWERTAGSSAKILPGSQVAVETTTGSGVWYSQVTIVPDVAGGGPSSFRATNTNVVPNASIDLTVVVDKASPDANLGVFVVVQYDANGDYTGPIGTSEYYAFNYVNSVVPSQVGNSKITGQEQLAQNYHTPISALFQMITPAHPGFFYDMYLADVDLWFEGSYVNGIEFYTDDPNETSGLLEGAGYSGWQYRVYDLDNGGAVNPDSTSGYIGAGAFLLAENKAVVWRYGSYMASDLFPDTIQDVIFPTSGI